MARMGATLGTLILLKALSEGPCTGERLLAVIEDESGERRDPRTLRRYLGVLCEAGFDIRRKDGRYELLESPAWLLFSDLETLATLTVVEALAEREPVYGEHLSSAASKLREALPKEAVRFADKGRLDFDLAFASDPPEDPSVLDTLRRAAHHNQKADILYHSLRSETVRWRTVEPVRVYHAHRAHRFYAYDPAARDYREFRVNRAEKARMLPDKFSPEAHARHLKPATVRLDKKTFTAYGKSVIADPNATITPLTDGGAIIEGAVASVFWTVRDLASLGPGAEVLGGPELKHELLNFLRDTLNLYA